MLDEAGQITDALAGTVLAGRPVVEIPVVGADELAFGIELGPVEMLPAWEAARSVVGVTGRWPLAVREWQGFSGAGWLRRLAADRMEALRQLAEMRYATGDHGLGRPEYPVTVPTPQQALGRLANDSYDAAGLTWALDVTARDYGHAPSVEEAVAAFGTEPGVVDLERWLLDWEATRTPATAVSDAHLLWQDQADALLLLPVANGWDTLAHIDLYDGGGNLGGTARLIAVVRSWHERFGAELVANWGTMLQFVVSRPPATVDAAWPLAVEQVAVAPDTIRLPGVPLRRHAQALVGRPTWFLQNRP